MLFLCTLLSQMQVPLFNIKGTGPDGVIVKADIEDYLGIPFILDEFLVIMLDVLRVAVC